MPKITVLVDNETSDARLACQHGLSIWLETDRSRILFDTGQDGLFTRNARALDIPVETATHLVLSHGHYDHTGGVPSLIETGARPRVIIHADSWCRRRSIHADGQAHPVGIPWRKELLSEHNLQVTVNRGIYCIEPGVYVISIGNFARLTARHPNLQRHIDGGWQPDTFPDEQILVLHTEHGLAVISGCTHSGIDTLLECVKAAIGDAPIYALLGGLHLGSVSEEGITRSAELLQDVRNVWVNRCTGGNACTALQGILGDSVQWMGAGAGRVLQSPAATPLHSKP